MYVRCGVSMSLLSVWLEASSPLGYLLVGVAWSSHLVALTLPETSNVIYDDFFAKITHHGTVVAEPFSHGFDDLR